MSAGWRRLFASGLAGVAMLALTAAAPVLADDDVMSDTTLLLMADIVFANEMFFERCGEITGETSTFAAMANDWLARNAETIGLIGKVLEHRGVEHDRGARQGSVSAEVESALMHGESPEEFCAYYSFGVQEGLVDFSERMPMEYVTLLEAARQIGD